MDTAEAARRWAEVWTGAWPAKNVEAIVALYAEGAQYRALVLREPELGTAGVRRYLEQNFAVEHDIECRFGEPFAGGDRAAVEWWASWNEASADLTMAGATNSSLRRRRHGRRPSRRLEPVGPARAAIQRMVTRALRRAARGSVS